MTIDSAVRSTFHILNDLGLIVLVYRLTPEFFFKMWELWSNRQQIKQVDGLENKLFCGSNLVYYSARRLCNTQKCMIYFWKIVLQIRTKMNKGNFFTKVDHAPRTVLCPLYCYIIII